MSTPVENHPLVGVWSAEAHEVGRPHAERVTYAFHADGTLAVAASTYAANGSWSASGEWSADVAALLPVPPGEGFSGWLTLRATVQVAADGDSFRMDAMVYRPTPSGTSSQHPATLVGKRFAVHPAVDLEKMRHGRDDR